MLFKRLSFYLAIAGIFGVVFLVGKLRAKPPTPPPLAEPARSPFENSVAATGIVEAKRENVKVATSKAGLVAKVFVQVGSEVKAGAPLFQLDDREAKARLQTMKSQWESLKATLSLEEAQLADLMDQFERVTKLRKDDVASIDELKRKEFLVNTARRRIDKAKADIQSSQSQMEAAQVDLDVLTVRASRDGVMLQVNVREGEYANTNPNEALMILGDVNKLQVRADVDEQNAPLVSPNKPAVAFLKGSTQNPLPLRFVRIEPFVIPKRSLTGDSMERVDTRVLQIIFELDRPSVPLYVGQQVDVFIERAKTETAKLN
ncbi:MAG: Secretion protein HlyD family protein [Verrucomicrobiales bacterium]|nr:Secretion protein HlyD family protein [Verrucomicrobiales bacterium]